MNGALRDRLKGLRLDMPSDVASRHVATVADELRTAPSPAAPTRRIWWRRRVVALSTVVGLAAPVSAAVAAESAVPGETLYPVKRATEWVRAWVDDTIAADHRLDELEVALERRDPLPVVEDRLRDAEAAVNELGPDTARAARLDAARSALPFSSLRKERAAAVVGSGSRRAPRAHSNCCATREGPSLSWRP
jgi:hypothetical protein